MWVYKNNARGGDHQRATGDFARLFSSKRAQEWGGKWAFGARSSNYLDEAVSVGDQVLCYQTDKRAIIGLATVSKLTSGEDARLWLRPTHSFPGGGVKIHQLKKQGGRYAQLQSMEAWRPGVISSLYPLDAAEARTMRKILGI
jgi:hypothetical protein